jgi:ABC-type branched-subunit amino acid transport system ATPase component
MRLAVQAVGGVYAGLSGALLAGFIGGWSPSAWEYVETLALLTAIIVGGLGNDAGVLLGVVIVPVLILQGVQFLPQIRSAPQLADDLGWIILGLLTIAFVFARPQGLIPERRPRLGMPAVPEGAAALPIPPEKLAQAEGWAQAQGLAQADKLAQAGASAQAGGSAQAAGPGGLAAIIAVRAGVPLTPAIAGDGGRAPILIVDGLVKRYGGVHAVDGASFTAAAGSITGLIGPNGAGKSTVLGLVSGFVRPDAGRITFDGRDVAALPAHRRARLGIVRTFQLPREFRALTTIENLLVAAPGQRGESAAGVAAGRWLWRRDEDELAEAARGLLRLFGMAEAADQRAGRLSGGQKRLLEVMRALMARPRLLLLDEPMAGLAPALAERLEAACRQLAGAGMSILLVEHELGVVERLCETVVVMAQGKVISEGRMAELRTRKEVQDAYVVG